MYNPYDPILKALLEGKEVMMHVKYNYRFTDHEKIRIANPKCIYTTFLHDIKDKFQCVAKTSSLKKTKELVQAMQEHDKKKGMFISSWQVL